MLVIPDLWPIEMTTQKDGTKKTITLEKFVEVTVSRNSYSAKAVAALTDARKRLMNGEVVDGKDINLAGVEFRRSA